MAEESRYFRFPVSILSEKTECIFERILSYCVGSCAVNVVTQMENTEQIAAEILKAEKYGYTLDDIDPDDYDEEVNSLVAGKVLGMSLGTVNLDAYRDALHSHPKPWGKMFVIFPRDPFWTFRNAKSDNETRKFLILCGVLAGIGDASYKKLQYERIGAIASGYSSAAEMQKFSSTKPRFTREQVRWTVDKLESIRWGDNKEKGWFVRCPLNRRHMYYSAKLNLAQLQAELVKLGTAKRKASMRDREASVRNMIETEIKRQELLEKIKSGEPSK